MRTPCVPGKSIASLALVLVFAWAAHAQQPMGTVSTRDAQVTGGLEVRNERASLLTNVAVTALDHPAPITLSRGGQVLVCSTSQFHLLRSGSQGALLFGLDRGAVELHTSAQAQDVLLTPDIRFTLEDAGTPQSPKQYDLRLRVNRNGDTCVNNVGADSPVILLTDPFSAATYRLIPGQHVLFEHGSLHEVVDNEQDPCGCPAAATVLATSTPAAAVAAAQHPFPSAISQDLAPAQSAANSGPAGEKHTQIATTLSYSPGAPPPGTEPTPAANPAVAVATAPPATPPGAHDIFHAIGHFFHHLFHGAPDASATTQPTHSEP